MIIIPKVTVGYRAQKNAIGHDISLTNALFLMEDFELNSVALQYSLLYYPSPSMTRQSYWGISTGAHLTSFLDGSGSGFNASVGALLGYQFSVGKKSHHFVEAKLGMPIFFIDHGQIKGPTYNYIESPIFIPSVSYGIGF